MKRSILETRDGEPVAVHTAGDIEYERARLELEVADLFERIEADLARISNDRVRSLVRELFGFRPSTRIGRLIARYRNLRVRIMAIYACRRDERGRIPQARVVR